jgi:hypothetical protein
VFSSRGLAFSSFSIMVGLHTKVEHFLGQIIMVNGVNGSNKEINYSLVMKLTTLFRSKQRKCYYFGLQPSSVVGTHVISFLFCEASSKVGICWTYLGH